MADPATALSETRRVLRPGGRVAFSVWGAPERNPWASIAGRIIVDRGQMPLPEPGAPRVFSMASEERTRALSEAAGFSAVRTQEIPVLLAFRDLDEYERWITEVGGQLAMVVRGLPEQERQAVMSQLTEAFAPFVADGRYELPGVALGTVGR